MIYSNRTLSKAHPGDAGFDLYAEPIRGEKALRLDPRTVTHVHTGVKVSLPMGAVGFISERSGFPFNHLPIIILGGVIDQGYTGELVVFIYNPTDERILIPWAKAIAQLVVCQLSDPSAMATKVLLNFDDTIHTSRGDRGFGSSNPEDFE